MKCPACGEENREGALLCELCQTLFARSPAPLAPSTRPRSPTSRPTASVPPPSNRADVHPPQGAAAPRTFALPKTESVNAGRSHWLLGFVVLGAVGAILLGFRVFRDRKATEGQPETLAQGASVPMPSSDEADLSAQRMVGRSGEDAYGYPVTEPNQLRLRALLRHRQLADLDSEIENYQTQFEADFHKENWVATALAAFRTREPGLRAHLDEWIRARPASFAAYAARGEYFHDLGWAARGTKLASATSPEQFRDMEQHHRLARADYEKAISLHPKLVAAYQGLIGIGSADSVPDKLMDRWLSQALVACPDCFYVRTVYLRGLQPRWGGNYQAMESFAAEAVRQSNNPRMRVLAGFAAEDQCQVASDDDGQKALTLCNQALEHGDSAHFFALRGLVRGNLKDTAGAIQDYDRALDISPQHVEAMARRGGKLAESKEWDRAERDLLLAHRLNPYDDKHDKRVHYLVESLVYEGTQQENAGLPAAATKLYEQALRLEPGHVHARIFLSRVRNLPPLIKPPEPDDTFESHKQADDTLVKYGRFQTIVQMWNGFIERHPDEARAYLERGGARANLGQGTAAIADMAKACELGLQKGCTDREILKHRFGQ